VLTLSVTQPKFGDIEKGIILMTDESNTGPVAAIVGVGAEVKTPAAKKQRSPQHQKAATEAVRVASKAAAAKSPTAKPNRSSEQERTEKLKLIETQVTKGTGTLRDAIKSVGISEQTYYNWKKVVRSVHQKDEEPVPASYELAVLVNLEEENQRLRKILAEKLRAENAELRNRLGLD
jgi:putative transposase